MAPKSTVTTTSRHSLRLFWCYSGEYLSQDVGVTECCKFKNGSKISLFFMCWCIQMRNWRGLAGGHDGFNVREEVWPQIRLSARRGVHLWVQFCCLLLPQLLLSLCLLGEKQPYVQQSFMSYRNICILEIIKEMKMIFSKRNIVHSFFLVSSFLCFFFSRSSTCL